MVYQQTIDILNTAYLKYHKCNFIDNDPIQIPHLFSKKQDIEIMGLFAATLAWGQRKTIISNCYKLIKLFENSPYDFIINHKDEDLKPFLDFKHRTFNTTDLLYFIAFLKQHYLKYESLETVFTHNFNTNQNNTKNALINFHNYFTSLEYFPTRTRKHIATPLRNSACKRLNMYLRWMVREDDQGIDFGIWQNIKPNQLLCPLDIHVERQDKRLGLLKRKPTDFKAVLELTENLKTIDQNDPVKYDFALFGLGVDEKN